MDTNIKRNRIIYWIATVWLALGMVSTGSVQIMRLPEEVSNMATLGYASYVMVIIGIWKILGAIAILLPGYKLVKEWAYAGFFFAMSGAIISHLVVGDTITKILPPLLLLVLTLVSWYIRPASRRLH